MVLPFCSKRSHLVSALPTTSNPHSLFQRVIFTVDATNHIRSKESSPRPTLTHPSMFLQILPTNTCSAHCRFWAELFTEGLRPFFMTTIPPLGPYPVELGWDLSPFPDSKLRLFPCPWSVKLLTPKLVISFLPFLHCSIFNVAWFIQRFFAFQFAHFSASSELLPSCHADPLY